jgi:DNA-binding transcriptional ArsR family regulator
MSAPEPPPAERLRLTDPRAMRALAHPLRIELLELLAMEGPLTATRAGELVGESPASCSFHLRQLAKYGFVEEAPRGGGRQRPWRLVHYGMHIDDGEGDDETGIAARELERMYLDRYLARLRATLELLPSFPAEWQAIATMTQNMLYLTVEEAAELRAEVLALSERFRPRLPDPAQRPAGSRPVELLAFLYPRDVPPR